MFMTQVQAAASHSRHALAHTLNRTLEPVQEYIQAVRNPAQPIPLRPMMEHMELQVLGFMPGKALQAAKHAAIGCGAIMGVAGGMQQ